MTSSSLLNRGKEKEEAGVLCRCGALAVVLEMERLLVEEVAVLLFASLDRRRLNGFRAWNEAMELRRRIELRWEEGGVSPDSLLREGMLGSQVATLEQ